MRTLVAVALTLATVGMPGGLFVVVQARLEQATGTVVPARLQQATGTIEGLAKNTAQQNLPGVWVQVRRSNGELVAIARTSSTGSFSFTGLNPEDYTIEILDEARRIVGTSAVVAVRAGATATVTVTATANGAIVAAGGGGLSLFGLGPIATVAVVGAAATTAIVAIRATQSDASPSR